jgi:dienelactone hydrolase
MEEQYRHLGIFSDWVAEAHRQATLYPPMLPGEETRRAIRERMGFSEGLERPLDVQVEARWEQDGLEGEQVSWSVGFGPRTQAWVFKPAGAQGRLAGVLALHDHSGFKFFGKEKIAHRQGETPDFLQVHYNQYYEGRAWVNALAQEGFVVVVHDTFLWGSRGFPEETMTASVGSYVPDWVLRDAEAAGYPAEVARYNYLCGLHEHVVAKYCNLLGSDLPGVVSREDRIALNYLLARPDVDAERTACMGLSGGGNRAALLLATAEHLTAGVIVGLMSTYEELLDHNVATHTWMLFPNGMARWGDWPDLAASRAPAPLLVQFDREDDLFTPEGMEAADRRLAEIYRQTGVWENYTGRFYSGPHKFDLEMQADAFRWLKENLQSYDLS